MFWETMKSAVNQSIPSQTNMATCNVYENHIYITPYFVVRLAKEMATCNIYKNKIYITPYFVVR